MEKGAGHYTLLDYARGLAALAVVFHHRGQHPKFPEPLNWFSEFGLVGVSVFFVISGFVIFQSSERFVGDGWRGAATFAWRRAKRIYPAFWASLVLCLLVATSPLLTYDLIPEERYHWNLYPPPFTLGDIAANGVLLYSVPPFHFNTPNVVYWTLEVEQQFYLLIFILLLPALARVRAWVVLGLTPIGILNGFDLLGVRGMSFYTLPRHWLAFSLGILAYLIVAKKVPRWLSVPVFVALVASGLAIFLRDTEAMDERTRMLAASLFAVAALALYPLRAWLARNVWLLPLRLLGLISYSLYLTHLAAFAINDWLFAGVLRSGSLSGYFSGIAMSLSLAGLFFLVFERPFMSAGQRTILPRPQPAPAQAPALSG